MNYTQEQIDAFCRESADRATAKERERCAKKVEESIEAWNTAESNGASIQEALEWVAEQIRK